VVACAAICAALTPSPDGLSAAALAFSSALSQAVKTSIAETATIEGKANFIPAPFFL
jgi:hypothetical protein